MSGIHLRFITAVIRRTSGENLETFNVKKCPSAYLEALDRKVLRHYNVKVKCSRYRPEVAQRVGRGIALLFHDRGTRRG